MTIFKQFEKSLIGAAILASMFFNAQIAHAEETWNDEIAAQYAIDLKSDSTAALWGFRAAHFSEMIAACGLSGVVVAVNGVVETVPGVTVLVQMLVDVLDPKGLPNGNGGSVDNEIGNSVFGGALDYVFMGLGKVGDFISSHSSSTSLTPYYTTQVVVKDLFSKSFICKRSYTKYTEEGAELERRNLQLKAAKKLVKADKVDDDVVFKKLNFGGLRTGSGVSSLVPKTDIQ